MENPLEIKCISEIQKWNSSNNNFINIQASEIIDSETIKFVMYNNETNIKFDFYTNTDLDYFFLENNSSNDTNLLLNEINLFIFSNESKKIDEVLDYIFSILSKSKNISDTNIVEVDVFNTCDMEDLDQITKKEWSKKDKLLRNNQKDINYFNIPQKLIYTSDIIFNIVSNEILSFNKKYDYLKIITEDNNIYKIIVQLNYKNSKKNIKSELEKIKTNYGYDFIELEIDINMNLYPFYPPNVNILRPKINNSLLYSIMDVEFLKFENWNLTNTLEFIILAFYKIFEDHAVIQIDSNLNHNKKAYNEIEYSLMQLSTKYSIDSQKYEDIHVDYVKISTNKTEKSKNTKEIWKTGVGYGHNGRKEWDIQEYISNQERINLELANEINNITDYIKSYIETESNELIINIIEPSCLFTLIKNRMNGVTLLEIEKNNVIYNNIVNLVELIVDNNLWKKEEISKLLYSSLLNINNEIETYFKLNNDIEHDSDQLLVYNKIKNIFAKLKTEKNNTEIDNIESSINIYETMIKDEIFDAVEINPSISTNYTFSNEFNNNSGNFDKKSLMRITREISSIQSSLPISYSSTVFFRMDSDNVNVVKFIITGPKDTPYESGCFEFDAIFTSGYPNSPPLVKLITTGNGTVRFNPNLYNCGKVCLSLLGTWSGQKGESWNKDTSTFLQVLVSIQSLILVDQPYFNEPGWERQMNTPEGDKRSFSYNDNLRLQTARWAILNQLKNPSKGFETAINKHFYLKKDTIIKTLEKWSKETIKKDEFNKVKDEIITLLDKLEI